LEKLVDDHPTGEVMRDEPDQLKVEVMPRDLKIPRTFQIADFAFQI
jgi:hypothetical protein